MKYLSLEFSIRDVSIPVFVQDQTSAGQNGGLPFSPRHVTTAVALVKAIKNKANVATDEVRRSRGEQKPWSCPDHKVAITEQWQGRRIGERG